MAQAASYNLPQGLTSNIMDADLISLDNPTPLYFPPGSKPSNPLLQQGPTNTPAFSADQIQYVHPQAAVFNNNYIRSEYCSQPIRRISSRLPSFSVPSSSESDSPLDLSSTESPHSPLMRASSGSITSYGTQSAPISDRLKMMNIIVDREIQSIDQNRSNTDKASCTIVNAFEQLNLNAVHLLKGDDITDVLKFCLRIPLKQNLTIAARQGKQLRQLTSAMFKECGLAFRVQIIALLCYAHKRSFLSFPSSSSMKNATLVVLLKVQNKKNKLIILDSESRVYQNFQDWQKSNTLPPATLFGPLNARIQNNPQNPVTIRMFKTPSCQTRKIVINAVDIVIGIGAVSAGVACLVTTGGLIIPASLIAGEIAASVYMGIRGTMSLYDRRKHRPKRR